MYPHPSFFHVGKKNEVRVREKVIFTYSTRKYVLLFFGCFFSPHPLSHRVGGGGSGDVNNERNLWRQAERGKEKKV